MFRSQVVQSRQDATPQIQRSASSENVEAAADVTHSIFTFLKATARAKSSRVDEFDGDVDEDNINESDDLYDDDSIDNDSATGPDWAPVREFSQADARRDAAAATHQQHEEDLEDLYSKQISDASVSDENKKKMATPELLSAPATSTNTLAESVQSLKRVPTRSETSRADALTDKLKRQLGIDDDDQLIGGEYFTRSYKSTYTCVQANKTIRAGCLKISFFKDIYISRAAMSASLHIFPAIEQK